MGNIVVGISRIFSLESGSEFDMQFFASAVFDLGTNILVFANIMFHCENEKFVWRYSFITM